MTLNLSEIEARANAANKPVYESMSDFVFVLQATRDDIPNLIQAVRDLAIELKFYRDHGLGMAGFSSNSEDYYRLSQDRGARANLEKWGLK